MSKILRSVHTFKESFTNEHGVYYPVVDYRTVEDISTGQVYGDKTWEPRVRSKDCSNPNFNNWLTGNFVPCRKCADCLHRRRWAWYFKAVTEIDTWERTWFITLTFRKVPDKPYGEIQKWIKRLRKNNPSCSFRYLCTTEFGSLRGRLHYHLLVHCDSKITRRSVEFDWSSGFSRARLVRGQPVQNAGTQPRGHNKAAHYVTKYLLKESQKIRASHRYGSGYCPF